LNLKTDMVLDQVRLVNVLGQVLETRFNVNGNTEIQVSQLPKGIYFIELVSGNDTGVRQIVVE